MHDEELYSQSLNKGRRTYFFDIKKTEQGELYLKITESKAKADGFYRNVVMVFDEDMNDFVASLRTTLGKYKELQVEKSK